VPSFLGVRDFWKIQAWHLADNFTVAIYEASQSFPREESYGMTSQIRRASSSVPANIVEGSARGTKREYLHFLHIARGSLAETQYLVHLASRLGYLDEALAQTLEGEGRATFACLHGLIRAVEQDVG